VAKYYNIDYSTLKKADKIQEVTCGVFGIEKVFDDILAL
jgi:hypothetical protein